MHIHLLLELKEVWDGSWVGYTAYDRQEDAKGLGWVHSSIPKGLLQDLM